MTAGTEFSESKVPEVQESPVIEPPKGKRFETTAVVEAERWPIRGSMLKRTMYSRLEMR